MGTTRNSVEDIHGSDWGLAACPYENIMKLCGPKNAGYFLSRRGTVVSKKNSS
jgi:hypothetical protein